MKKIFRSTHAFYSKENAIQNNQIGNVNGLTTPVRDFAALLADIAYQQIKTARIFTLNRDTNNE